jgi:DNA-binding NarL/FixJ family response regulator
MLGIVIAETDDSVRRRLVQALVVERGLEVVGTAPDPVTALDLVCRTKPDLVLVDLGMPRSGGLVLIRAILLTLPDTVVVIRQAGSDELTVLEAFRAGAGGFLVEDGFDDHITSCVRLLTPAQVQKVLAAAAPMHERRVAEHRGRSRARRGTRPLLRCTVSHPRDGRRQESWRTGDHLSRHGRRRP